jgi:hypothetical protein
MFMNKVWRAKLDRDDSAAKAQLGCSDTAAQVWCTSEGTCVVVLAEKS